MSVNLSREACIFKIFVGTFLLVLFLYFCCHLRVWNMTYKRRTTLARLAKPWEEEKKRGNSRQYCYSNLTPPRHEYLNILKWEQALQRHQNTDTQQPKPPVWSTDRNRTSKRADKFDAAETVRVQPFLKLFRLTFREAVIKLAVFIFFLNLYLPLISFPTMWTRKKCSSSNKQDHVLHDLEYIIFS